MLGMLFASLQLLAQNRTVGGVITDSTGQALPGVSIRITGTKIGTVTNNNGQFSLSVPQNARTLEISNVGFVSQTVAIPSNGQIRIALHGGNAPALDEVIVTGISRVKRVEYTGAASHISRESVSDKPVGSFDQLLQGQSAGLLALTSSGQPGNPTTVILRGQTSIAGGSNPLYIMDGIPIEAAVFQGLNPNDFESVDVLRDASASALYGSRGSAGVIIITTRRGSAGKMKLGYNAQFGIKSKPDFAFDPMNTTQLLQAQHDYGATLNRISPTTGTSSIPGWYYSKDNPRYATLSATDKALADHLLDSISQINTNWRDYFFRNGPFSNNQITLSGGTGKTRLYSSLELYNETGITPRTDMKRVTFRNNLDYADDKLTVALSSNIAYVKRDFQQSTTTNSTGNPFLATNITVPYAKVYQNDTFATGVGASFVGANALNLTQFDKNYNNQIKVTLGLTLGYKLTNDLTANLTSGVDFRETQATNYGSALAFSRETSTDIRTHSGFQSESLARYFSPDIRPSLNYSKLFADKHKVNLTLLGEYIGQYQKGFNMTGYGIDPRTPNTPAAITTSDANNKLFPALGGYLSKNNLYSGLIQGQYTYNEKYTLTGSFREDGSSKLAPGNKWQGFYSAGAVWNITSESFLKDNKVFNNLRLRASYGGAGNNDNFPSSYGDYGSIATFAANGNYSGLTTLLVSNIGNPFLKWERTFTLNIGLDYSLLNNRIYGSFDVYDKRTKDLFVQKQLPAELGGYSVLVNGGLLQNKGIEWDISVDVVKKRDLTWTLYTRGAYNKNNILSLAGLPSYPSGTSLIAVGKPLGSHYEVKWAGVDAATGAPLYYTKNGTLTTTYTASDAVQDFGTWEAPWKGGFGSNLNYKAFYLSVLFSWQQGAHKEDNLEYFVENPGGFLGVGYNQSVDLHFWQRPGDIVNTPGPQYATSFSSKIIHDASFLRLRDVTLSYSLPRQLTTKIKFISSARLYVEGSNLFIWTKWRGMDPEAGPLNINLSEFPNTRAFTGGLNITF